MTPESSDVLQGDDQVQAASAAGAEAVLCFDPVEEVAGSAAGVNAVDMSGAEVLSSAYSPSLPIHLP